MTKEEIDYFVIQEHFAKLCRWIAELEREECAKIADLWSVSYPHPSKTIAEQIRKRGQE
jgi:hypothetical protein